MRIVANSLHLSDRTEKLFLYANAAELSILLIYEKKSLVF